MRTLALIAVAAVVAAPAATADSGPHMKSIVRAWSAALNANDNARVARLFAVPAIVIQAPYEYKLTSRRQISVLFGDFPCAGHVVSITVSGVFATVVFRLANRGKHPCDAPGTLAAARFEIRHGKITSWEQIAVPKQTSPGAAVA